MRGCTPVRIFPSPPSPLTPLTVSHGPVEADNSIDSVLISERAQVPTNPLINLSEAHLMSLLPSHSTALLSLTSTHLVRLYPKGLRVFSHNLDPMEAWRQGVQVAALNFQTFDRARQVDRAMFEGSLGWVLKPGWMRGEKGKGRVRVRLTIGGVTGRKPSVSTPFLCGILFGKELTKLPFLRPLSALSLARTPPHEALRSHQAVPLLSVCPIFFSFPTRFHRKVQSS